MILPRIGFIVFGVHRGINDPLGKPFIDENLVAASKNALRRGD